MCQRTACSTCGKPTFAGCGRHVESVLGDVPRDARCKCREPAQPPEGTAANQQSGFLRALLRRLGGSP